MATSDAFIQYPLSIDAATKAISSGDSSLAAEIEELNKMSRLFVGLQTPNGVPGAPSPVNPQRSVQITKLRDSGNAEFKKGRHADAVKYYDLAIRMAIERPGWEASGLVREELSVLYGNRAQAMISQQQWPEAAVDAEISVELKRIGNVKGWWRRGQALKEMGRLDEANDYITQGLEFERNGPEKERLGELETLLKDVKAAIEKS